MDKSTMNTFELIEFIDANTRFKGEPAVTYALSLIWNQTDSIQKEKIANLVEKFN